MKRLLFVFLFFLCIKSSFVFSWHCCASSGSLSSYWSDKDDACYNENSTCCSSITTPVFQLMVDKFGGGYDLASCQRGCKVYAAKCPDAGVTCGGEGDHFCFTKSKYSNT